MSSLAEFLKGTVNDSLKKLFEPAGILPAGLFVLLNLVFVYPAADRENKSLAETYKHLDQVSQAIVLGVLIIGLGVVLLSAGNFALDTLSGRTWRGALLYSLGSRLRDRQRDRLTKRIGRLAATESKATVRGETPDMLRWRLRSRYSAAPERQHPPGNRASSATSLGDALRASEWMTTDRFGIDRTVLWEPLRAAIAGDYGAPAPGEGPKDTAVRAVEDEKAVLNLVGMLTVVLGSFALEAAVVFGLLGHWSAALHTLLVLPGAYVIYRIAVTKAISWGDAIDNVVALHRDKLRALLGLPEPDGPDVPEAARRQFRELSYVMRWGGDVTRQSTPSAPESEVLSKNASRQISSAIDQRPMPGGMAAEHSSAVHDVLLVTRTSDGHRRESVSVLVRHRLTPRLLRVPSGALLLNGDDERADGLIWRSRPLGRGATERFDYKLKRWKARLRGGGRMTVEEAGPETLNITVHGPVGARRRLRVWHTLAYARKAVLIEPQASFLEARPRNGRCTWALPQLNPGAIARFAVHFRDPDPPPPPAADPLVAPLPDAPCALRSRLLLRELELASHAIGRHNTRDCLDAGEWRYVRAMYWVNQPADAAAHNNCGCAHALLGDWADAREQFDLSADAAETAQARAQTAKARKRAARAHARARHNLRCTRAAERASE